MAIRVIVSDTALGDHANTVKAAISLGYGSDISNQIEIKTGGLSADLAYADSIGAIAVVRSTTGYSSYASLAESYYPRILMFMPLGSNSNVELTTALSVIVSSGAGDTENKNNTAYGNGLEFWDNDYDTATSDDVSSYSNGVVAGKLLKIRDTLSCSWWEARYRARKTADRTEDNRPVSTEWHNLNGYGKINISNAVAYTDEIISDVNINNTEMITQEFFIDIAENNSDNIIRFYRGDNHTLKFYIKNNDTIFDLTGYSAIISVKEKISDTTFLFQLYGGEVSINTALGLITAVIIPEDTISLTPGEYYYDVQIKSSTKTYTVVSDTLELKGDVTTTTIPSFIITENSQILIFE